MKRKAAKIFQKLLNFEQIQRCIDIKKVITGDESWVYGNDIGTKAQLSQWKSPGKKAKTEKSTSSSVKCEYFAHLFFRLQWRGAS